MHTEGATLSLRESKKAATRRQLSATARRLALEHGLDAVTIEQICGDVGVSVRTFFNYFASKEAAVIGDALPVGTPATRQDFLAGGPTGDLLADVLWLLDPSPVLEQEGREGLLVGLRLAQREPRLLAVLLARQTAQEQEIAALVAERQGPVASSTGCAALAGVAQALTRAACRAWFEADDGRPLSHHLERARSAVAEELTRSPAAPAAATS